MKVLDPTYLRYVYDGLKSGAVKKEDHTSLPVGHIGIYEMLFSASSDIVQKKKLLEFFTVWSLLKREVTAEFTAKIIKWKAEDVLNYINMYSRLFNAISANKYILFHDSLRIFVLQYASENIIEEIIASLNRIQNEAPNDYCTIFLNDHNFSLAFSKESYHQKCLDFVSTINKDVLPKSLVDSHHQRAFTYASHIYNYTKQFNSLTKLYVKYDEITNSPISIEKEIEQYEIYGIDYVIERGFTLGNVNISFVYWIYFIEHLLNEDSDVEVSSKIAQLVNHLNKYVLIHENIKESLLTTNYIEYINEKLSNSGFLSIKYTCKIEGIPKFMYDFGHDDEISPMNTSYIIDKKIDPQICLQKLVENGHQIEAFKLKEIDIVKLSKRIIIYILEEKFELLDGLLKSLKLDVLVNPDKSYDDLFNFDNFIFETFLISIHYKPNQKYVENWITYFITTKEFGRDILSFFLMIRKIYLNGDMNKYYRKYFFPPTDMTKSTDWIIDEMSTIMYVLSEKGRFSEIKYLLSSFMEVVTDFPEYEYHSDLLASAYWNKKSDQKSDQIIYNYYSKNKGSGSVHQLSYVLCLKLEFLELVSIQLYNANEQSEIGSNYIWAYNIIESIYLRLGDVKFIEYITKGFDTYIAIMGRYHLDEHVIDVFLPEENIWRIEWWIISNFYSAIQSSSIIIERDKINIANKIIDIFSKYSYDSSINLDLAVKRYQSYRINNKIMPDKNFEYLFHQDEYHYLKSFSMIQFDKTKINKIAGSIKNGNCILS